MVIKTKIDDYKNLINELNRIIHFEPFSDKFDNSYNNLIEILLQNISENREDLLVTYSKDIDRFNDEISNPLSGATDKERAFYNAGMFRGLCDLIKSLGDYDKSLEKFIKPYLDLEVSDVVYIMNNNILYKTTVVKKIKKKIQVKYGNRWFTQDDYLEYIFPYKEKENLYKNGKLNNHNNCDKCAGFRQGKCAYGYSVGTYKGVSYRFDNTKYQVVKGRPKEACSKNIKR